MNIHILAVLLSLLMLCFVIDLVRRHKLTFKYALAWLLVSAAGVFFAIFHKFLFGIAAFLGFELPSNFIFFSLFCVFVFLSLIMTVFLCQQNNRNDTMIQKIALLEYEIKQLKQKSDN
jgi:hypothetical protein